MSDLNTRIFVQAFMILITGVAVGFLMISFFKLPSITYATMLTFAILCPFIVFVVGDAKYFLWSILILCLPITVDVSLSDTGYIGGTAGYLVSAFDIILVVLLILWFGELISGKKRINFFPKLSIPAISLLSIATLSMVFASFPNLSLFEVIEMIKMYVCFLYIANNIKKECDVKFIITILLLGLFFESTLGVAQHRYSDPFFPTALGGPPRIDSRISGTWVSPNDFAWYLTFILPIAMSMFFSQIKLIYRIACTIILGIGSASLMWSSSRGGWISFLIAALFVTPLVFIKIKGKIGLIKTFASIIVVIMLIIPLIPRISDKISARFNSPRGESAAESRKPQYEMAYNVIKNNPFIGVGINNYAKTMKNYDITEEGIESLTSHAVHNIFLHIAAEMGLAGLVIFLWFVTVIFIEGIRYVLSNQGYMVYVVIGILAGILAFLAHGLVDTASIGSKMYMFVWFFAGIIFAIIEINTSKMIIPRESYNKFKAFSRFNSIAT